jgi:signal transduction histidine kinase/ActR/RegA family two-component response regulator
LLTFVIVMLVGIFIIRQHLISHEKEMSVLLLSNYAAEEEDVLNTYKNLLTLCANYVDEREQEGATIARIQSGLSVYFGGFDELHSGIDVRATGFVDGNIISNGLNLNEDDEDENADDTYDYRATEWYQGAMDADGEIYVTDAYPDPFTGETIITLAKKAAHSESMVAFDVFFDDYHTGRDSLQMPDDAAYYLCDGKGTVIYYETEVYDSYDELQQFAYHILEEADDSSSFWYLASYVDARGSERSAYVQRLQNGWTIILTIPRKNAIGRIHTAYYVLGVIFVLGFLLISYLAVRDYRGEKKNQALREEQQSTFHTTQIYEKTMRSTMLAYREVCYVDLVKDTFQIVYPQNIGRKKKGRFQEGLARLFKDGTLQSDEQEEVMRFLSLDNIRKELAQQDCIETRCQYRGNNGVRENSTLTITVVEKEAGRPVSATLSVRSIENTLRQEAEQRELLTLSAQRAEAANRAKSDFLSRMSHDIRTPLNAILGMTAIAAMHIDDKERVLDALNKITLSGRHLLGLINSVLDMSKIESGKITLSEVEFNLSDSIQSLITLFQVQMEEKKQEFKVNIKAMEHENVIGDDQRLQQIFNNVLGNAVKFTPEGGTISLDIREKNKDAAGRACYEFVFTDSGIGMDKEFLEQIFEPFARASDSRTSRIEGVGLGMPIALNIAKMMGGDIRVESEVGKGSRFTVTVYLKINNTAQDDLHMPREDLEIHHNEDGQAQLETFRNKDYAGKRVLLVEDNELNIEVAETLLQAIGLEVDKAVDGQEAVKMVSAQPAGYYTMIFMDIQMPVMNGYEAASRIRKIGRKDLETIPIVAMTADAFADDVQKAMEAGMNGHISKPIDLERLQKVIEKFVNIERTDADGRNSIQ